MRIIVSWVIALAVVLAVIGFYRGWFTMSSSRDVGDNKVDINLTVDPDQVKDDVDAVKEESRELTEPASP